MGAGREGTRQVWFPRSPSQPVPQAENFTRPLCLLLRGSTPFSYCLLVGLSGRLSTWQMQGFMAIHHQRSQRAQQPRPKHHSHSYGCQWHLHPVYKCSSPPERECCIMLCCHNIQHCSLSGYFVHPYCYFFPSGKQEFVSCVFLKLHCCCYCLVQELPCPHPSL